MSDFEKILLGVAFAFPLGGWCGWLARDAFQFVRDQKQRRSVRDLAEIKENGEPAATPDSPQVTEN